MNPFIILGAAEQQPAWQSLFFSFSSGIVGAISAIAAVYVFLRKEGRSGWQVATMMSFGSLLIGLPVLRSFSLSWTEDGKPVLNLSLNAVLAAAQEAKAEAAGARKEAAAAVAKLDAAQTSIAALTSGIDSTKVAITKLSGTVDSSQKECIALLTDFENMIVPKRPSYDTRMIGGTPFPISNNNLASWRPDREVKLSQEAAEIFLMSKDANSDGKLDLEELTGKDSNLKAGGKAPSSSQPPAPGASANPPK